MNGVFHIVPQLVDQDVSPSLSLALPHLVIIRMCLWCLLTIWFTITTSPSGDLSLLNTSPATTAWMPVLFFFLLHFSLSLSLSVCLSLSLSLSAVWSSYCLLVRFFLLVCIFSSPYMYMELRAEQLALLCFSSVFIPCVHIRVIFWTSWKCEPTR